MWDTVDDHPSWWIIRHPEPISISIKIIGSLSGVMLEVFLLDLSTRSQVLSLLESLQNSEAFSKDSSVAILGE